MLPGNAPTIGYPPAAGAALPFIAGGGAGPDTDQAAQLAASVLTGLMAGAVPQGRPMGSSEDLPSPQRFTNHPRLIDAINTTAVGDDTAAEALPGRIFPGWWDGESGWAAPGVDY